MLTRLMRRGLVAMTAVFLATAANAAGDQPAPTFTLPARGGATIDLAQYKGQVGHDQFLGQLVCAVSAGNAAAGKHL